MLFLFVTVVLTAETVTAAFRYPRLPPSLAPREAGAGTRVEGGEAEGSLLT